MGKIYIDADAEAEMRQVLSFLDLQAIVGILRKQIGELPPEKKKFYLDEINIWGSLGDKQQLISDIIAIAEEYIGLDEIIDVYDDLTKGIPKEADRYDVKGVPEGFEWSEETSPTERLKWMKYYQYPGYYSRYEKSLIQPHPEQDYADPNLLKREWEEGKVLGLGPIIPESLPKLHELEPADQEEIKKLMQEEIFETVQPIAAQALPRPYMIEMVYDYLYLTGNEEAAERFRIDGVPSRTRFGFNTRRILKRLFDVITLEDLYLYWNSIVNYRTLPWVNEQYALDRFGGGKMGENIGTMYETWKGEAEAIDPVELQGPEQLEWAERVSPSEAYQWEYSR